MSSLLGAAAAGSAVSGGLGIIGSLVNYGLNKKLAQQQNQYNIDMWKMQADYNSPQAQMQRFSEAGLNPNLIYGQGSNGNMSSPPQQVVPQAPDISHHMAKLGEAFNIENLKTLIAHRKEAEANADNAKTNATRNSRELNAEYNMGQMYTFDTNTGSFVRRPVDGPNQVSVVHPSAYYLNALLAKHYLIPYRSALMDWQKNYLVPQVQMANYERKYQPASFWIGQSSKAAAGLGSLVQLVNPKSWIMPLGRGGSYMAPNGRVYSY